MNAALLELRELGLPVLLAAFAMPFFSSAAHYYIMRKILPNRLNICVLIAMSAVYAIWYNLRSPGLYGTNYHFFMGLFINAWTPCMILFFFKGKIWKRAIVWIYLEFTLSMCKAVSLVPVLLVSNRRGDAWAWSVSLLHAELSPAQNLLYILTFAALAALTGYLSCKIWRRLPLIKFRAFYVLFIALPLGQQNSLSHVVQPDMGDLLFGLFIFLGVPETQIYNALSLFGVVVSLASSAALLYYIVSHEKRAAVDTQLHNAKRELELEQTRNREAARQSEEMAKIRHDFNNQLASILQLVRSGEDKTAKEIVDALTDEINLTCH